LDLLSQCWNECGLDPAKAAGVGITVPGMADMNSGTLLYAPFLGWRDVPVREIVSTRLSGPPVTIANDVNACALGETYFGQASSFDNVLWVTVSTGVGGGIIVNKQLYEGEYGIAGEIGHVTVEWENPRRCSCGQWGCLEAHASGTAIAERAMELMQQNGDAPLARYLREQRLPVSAASIAQAARSGVPEAIELYRSAGHYLGRAFSFAANLFNFGAVIVGGGVSLSMELWLPAAQDVFRRSVIHETNRNMPILATGLGYEAGLKGAAALAFHYRAKNGGSE